MNKTIIISSVVGVLLIGLLLFWVLRRKATALLPVEETAKAKHGQVFLDKTWSIEKKYGMPKGTLTSIMWGESGLNPRAVNSIGAGGLIGFLVPTMQQLGTNSTELLSMSAIRQLDYVDRFYALWKSAGVLQRAKTPEQFYMIAFYPYAVGKPSSYELGSHNGTAATVYRANSPLDWNKDGKLTVKDHHDYLKNNPRFKGTIFQA